MSYPSLDDTQNLIDQDTNFAADSNPLLAKKSSKHARAILGTAFLFTGVITVVIVSATSSDL